MSKQWKVYEALGDTTKIFSEYEEALDYYNRLVDKPVDEDDYYDYYVALTVVPEVSKPSGSHFNENEWRGEEEVDDDC